MPRFFDDYGNAYLTHDSAAGRKQQRRGWKFRENFRLYYQAHLEEWQRSDDGLAAAQADCVKRNGPSCLPPLPDEWKEGVDPCTGNTFYEHKETGKRNWARPNFIPTVNRGNARPSNPPPSRPAQAYGGPPRPTYGGGPPPEQFRYTQGPPPPPPQHGYGQFRQPPPPHFNPPPLRHRRAGEWRSLHLPISRHRGGRIISR